jgi:hypothetical protein
MSVTTTGQSARSASVGVRWGGVRAEWAIVGALTLIAFGLRVVGMEQSLLGDELFAFAEIHGRDLPGVIEAIQDGVEVSPPLYFVLAWASAQIGDPTTWIRLPSLLFGTALVPMTYLLAVRSVGRRAAIISAAIAAISPFAIFYATEARPYATLAFFSVASTLFLLRALEDGGRWWVGYALTAAAVAYSHYTGIFVLATQTAWALVVHREQLRQIVLATLAGAALYLPWLSQVRGKGQLDVYGPFVLTDELIGRPIRALVGHPILGLGDVPGPLGFAIFVAAVLVAAIALLVRRPSRPSSPVVLLISLAAATPIGMFATAAIVGNDVFLVRNLTASVPAATICLGALLASASGRLRLVVPACAVLGIAVGTVAILSSENQRTDARAIAALLDRRADSRDVVVTVAPTDTTSNRPLDPYLRAPHVRVFGDAMGYPTAFRRAASSDADVFVVYPDIAEIRRLIVPPPELAEQYELRSEERVPGFSGGLAMREFGKHR